jgi:8-hydroxy-5-deazaflavin:NADPH oxidoreductase
MQLTIIGTGNMGRAIGTRMVAGGNSVKLLGTDRGAAEQLASELAANAPEGVSVEGGPSGDPISGDVVVLAVWHDAAKQVVTDYADQLEDKVVVDISNPVDTETFDGLITPADSSAAEEIAKLVPGSAKVVKAFNTTFAGTLVEGEVGGQPLDVFVAADDDGAKATVSELIEAGGLNVIDAGPLRRARQIEALGFLHMTIQDELGTGYGSTVKILS